VDIAVLLNGASELSRRYNEPVAEYLRDLGLRRILLSERFIHAKLIVVDDYVILGFHNLTPSSVASRLELSMTIESKSLANALDTLFEHFYSEEERRWMVAAMELWGEIQEPMVLCKFVGIPPAYVVGLYSYATGIRRTTPDLMKSWKIPPRNAAMTS
jgi:phosphatidylserine/phosphatidylglycerophosphate/cardiolipin synthase-like enzyme